MLTPHTTTTPTTPSSTRDVPLHPLFPLGQIVATPNALALLESLNLSAFPLLNRHRRGDWGDVCAEDVEQNNWAAANGGRILSVYTLKTGTIWVITEADRSVTTVLLPEDY